MIFFADFYFCFLYDNPLYSAKFDDFTFSIGK